MTKDTEGIYTSEELAAQKSESGIATKQASDFVTIPMQQVLSQLGIETREIERRVAPLFWKMGWEELCIQSTPNPKIKVSPVMTITKVNAFPEDTHTFDDYVGYVYCEAVTEEGETVSFSHAYAYRETGELLPLTAWLTEKPTPYLARIAYIETNKQGRHVVKPVPVDL